jgi:anti-anti-sigma regulatory factor
MTPFGTVEVEHHHADLWVVALVGEHDLSTVSVIEQRLADVHLHGTRVILDLSTASFVDTTVIAVIVRERQRAASSEEDALAVVAPTGSQPRRALELVQLNGVLLAESRAEAYEAMQQGRDTA